MLESCGHAARQPGTHSVSKVTIYDIANHLGCSSSTVARVLRGDVKAHQRRSLQTIADIQRVAKELGYKPNLRARSFARESTRGIGLMYSNPAWVFHGVNDIAVQHLERGLRRKGYHLVFVPVADDGHWREIVLGGQVDGCVALQPLAAEIHAAMKASGIPLVSLGGESTQGVLRITAKDFDGARQATSMLHGMGHRRIAFVVHEHVHPHFSVEERWRGYAEALREAGIEPSPLQRAREDEVHAMLRPSPLRPTALLCYSDLDARIAMHAAWCQGVAIPRELSVLAFNDVPSARLMTPPLSTVGWNASRSGTLAAQVLLRILDGSSGKSREAWPLKQRVILRASTGPAPVADTPGSVQTRDAS